MGLSDWSPRGTFVSISTCVPPHKLYHEYNSFGMGDLVQVVSTGLACGRSRQDLYTGLHHLENISQRDRCVIANLTHHCKLPSKEVTPISVLITTVRGSVNHNFRGRESQREGRGRRLTLLPPTLVHIPLHHFWHRARRSP